MTVNRSSKKEDLVTYVRDVMGIDAEDKTREELLEMIEGSTDSAEPAPITPEISKKKGKIKIMIPKQETPLGDADVFVAVNDKTYLIKRGEEVEVPPPVVESLKNAVERRARQNDDGSLTHYEIPAYPFQVVG